MGLERLVHSTRALFHEAEGGSYAADPFIDRELYQRSFQCPDGLFPVEVYGWRDPANGSMDRLGIRIRFGSWAAAGSGGGWADPDGL